MQMTVSNPGRTALCLIKTPLSVSLQGAANASKIKQKGLSFLPVFS